MCSCIYIMCMCTLCAVCDYCSVYDSYVVVVYLYLYVVEVVELKIIHHTIKHWMRLHGYTAQLLLDIIT